MYILYNHEQKITQRSTSSLRKERSVVKKETEYIPSKTEQYFPINTSLEQTEKIAEVDLGNQSINMCVPRSTHITCWSRLTKNDNVTKYQRHDREVILLC